MIDFRDVTVSYPLPDGTVRKVYENLTLSIKQGEMAYVIGPSGSGKSTLMRMIYMDLKPDKGVVRVGEYRSDTITPKEIPYLRRTLGVVFQDFQLLPDRSVYENVAFALYATGKSGAAVKNRVMQVLGRVGLQHKWKRFPHEISGGEQQRVTIARAIANEPWILLADEPTGNLDPRVADEIQKLLISLHRQGMTLLMSTHDYRLVKKFPARTLALMKGQIVDVDAKTIGDVAKKGKGGRTAPAVTRSSAPTPAPRSVPTPRPMPPAASSPGAPATPKPTPGPAPDPTPPALSRPANGHEEQETRKSTS